MFDNVTITIKSLNNFIQIQFLNVTFIFDFFINTTSLYKSTIKKVY